MGVDGEEIHEKHGAGSSKRNKHGHDEKWNGHSSDIAKKEFRIRDMLDKFKFDLSLDVNSMGCTYLFALGFGYFRVINLLLLPILTPVYYR